MPIGSPGYANKLNKNGKVKNGKIIDYMVYFAGIAGPVMTLPQVAKIWVEKNASGVAIETWVTYLLLSVIWISYGILHKQKPILIMYVSYFVINLSIVAGILIYS